MKSLGGALGWGLLALTLALPALMFWNWWQRLQRKAEPVEARGAAHGTSKVFNGEESPLAAPKSPAVSTAVSTAARSMAPSQSVVSTPRARPTALVPPAGGGIALANAAGPASFNAAAIQSSSPTAAAAPASMTAARAAPAAKGAASVGGAAAPAVAISTAVVYAPKTDRDPFVSLIEVQMARDADRRAEMARLEEERRRREAEEAARRTVKKEKVVKARPAEPPIESKLTIQGIISTPEHKSAIVNNDVVNVGEVVMGAEVVEITDSAVIFSYKGRRVRMVVPR